MTCFFQFLTYPLITDKKIARSVVSLASLATKLSPDLMPSIKVTGTKLCCFHRLSPYTTGTPMHSKQLQPYQILIGLTFFCVSVPLVNNEEHNLRRLRFMRYVLH